VYDRLPHHLVFHRFSHWYMARHALLLVVWVAVSRAIPCRVAQGELGQRPLRAFVGGAVAIAIAGIIIDQSTLYFLDLAASVLRYYWYRLSDAILPLGVSLAVVAFLSSRRSSRPKLVSACLMGLALVALGNLVLINVQRRTDLRPGADIQMLSGQNEDAPQARQVYDEWRRACSWIKNNTSTSACFITPHMQQTFKWYAQRSEVCSWKDVPQDAAALVRWWNTQQEIYPRRVIRYGLVWHGEQRLVELARKYEADYVLIDRNVSLRPLLLPRVYPTALDGPGRCYEVYAVPRADRPPHDG
jgi:hypothetical protein